MKNQNIARLSFGFLLCLAAILSGFGNILWVFPLHLIAGIIAFCIFNNILNPFRNWNLAKTGAFAVFALFGFFSLLILGCREQN